VAGFNSSNNVGRTLPLLFKKIKMDITVVLGRLFAVCSVVVNVDVQPCLLP